MDALDAAILREVSRDRVVVWGSQDPRLSAERIARAVCADPTTVRDRLRAWQACGFLLGFTVLPNTSLFGAGLASGAIRVPDLRDKARVIGALRDVPDVVGVMDHVGEWVGLGYVDASAAQLHKALTTLAAIPGVAEVTPAFRVPTPSAEVDLTPLDWRIVKALRAHPRDGLSVAADAVGVSTRTFARRYARLVEGKALWSIGMFDFGCYQGALIVQLIAHVATEAEARAGVNALRGAFPRWVAWHVIPPPLSNAPTCIADLYFHVESAGEAERLQQAARGLPGVVEVELYHPLRFEMFGAWGDARVAEALAR